MEKMNLSEYKILEFAKKALVYLGYPDNIEIIAAVRSGFACYEAYYEIEEVKQKHIKPLKINDIVKLVKYGMEINGYDDVSLNIKVRDNKICYSVETTLVTYGGKGSKKRR